MFLLSFSTYLVHQARLVHQVGFGGTSILRPLGPLLAVVLVVAAVAAVPRVLEVILYKVVITTHGIRVRRYFTWREIKWAEIAAFEVVMNRSGRLNVAVRRAPDDVPDWLITHLLSFQGGYVRVLQAIVEAASGEEGIAVPSRLVQGAR